MHMTDQLHICFAIQAVLTVLSNYGHKVPDVSRVRLQVPHPSCRCEQTDQKPNTPNAATLPLFAAFAFVAARAIYGIRKHRSSVPLSNTSAAIKAAHDLRD